MKTKDIKIGTDYAIGSRRSTWRSPYRGTVIALERHRANSWNKGVPGVRVRTEDGFEQTAPVAQVLRTWEEHERLLDESEKRERERRTRDKKAREESAPRVDLVNKKLGFEAFEVTTNGSVEITYEGKRRIFEVVEEMLTQL